MLTVSSPCKLNRIVALKKLKEREEEVMEDWSITFCRHSYLPINSPADRVINSLIVFHFVSLCHSLRYHSENS